LTKGSSAGVLTFSSCGFNVDRFLHEIRTGKVSDTGESVARNSGDISIADTSERASVLLPAILKAF